MAASSLKSKDYCKKEDPCQTHDYDQVVRLQSSGRSHVFTLDSRMVRESVFLSEAVRLERKEPVLTISTPHEGLGMAMYYLSWFVQLPRDEQNKRRIFTGRIRSVFFHLELETMPEYVIANAVSQDREKFEQLKACASYLNIVPLRELLARIAAVIYRREQLRYLGYVT